MKKIHNKTVSIIVACLFLVLLGSCQKSEEYTTSPRENFEALWKIIDEHYCFFEYKDIDWNEVHTRYSVQIKDSMNQYALFDVLSAMLKELKDGHTNLISSFDVSRYWEWYENYPDNFVERIVMGPGSKYLGTDYKSASGLKYKILLPDSVGYIYYESFSSGVGEGNLDYVFLHFKNCKGLIIDVRNNGGGSLTYSDLIAARFAEEKMTSGYILHKTGPGHNDFSTPYPLYLTPSDRIRWLRPTVVLTNRRCYSATNDFVNKMRMLPYVTIIGDKTGGGSGFPFYSELPNGWSVRFSASPMLNEKKEHTEFGIDPDIHVDMVREEAFKINNAEDTIIETAIRFLVNWKPNSKIKSDQKFAR